MADKGFSHLHLHTQYSLLDGAISFDRLFKRCQKLGMDSVAMTDHGNMFGAVEFYTAAQKTGVKPILGMEAYIAPDSRFEKQKGGGVKENAYHLLLLAENNTGYKNLMKLSSIGYTEGFYYRPRIDKEVLAQFNEGLICTSACIAGEVPVQLLQGGEDAARRAIEQYLKIFGTERFFVEIQEHENNEHPQLGQMMADLAQRMGVGVVATNDVHFLEAEDYKAHNALCCISTGKKVNDPERMVYPPDVYLKSPDEMRQLFPYALHACDLTLEIARRCNVELDLKSRHAPKYTPSDGSTPEDYLSRLVYEGAKRQYGTVTPEIRERIERELEVISGKGFASYFLIVWDFCNYARANNIPVGARGSAVGTVVGYCLGVCDVDPIRYDLLFERFMDPQRTEMPDIDIDICQDGRGRVLEYVRGKYGHIAQIITFGTMKARAAIRDVCRVMDVPLAEADKLAKLIPMELKMTLDKALDVEPDLKKAYDENPHYQEVIDVAKRLEGLCRHASVHACGVVIADSPLTNFLPLYKQGDSDDLITQFEGPMVEKVGLLKMDFLGLRTLSIIQRAVDLIEQIHNKKIDIEKIDITDQKVYQDVFAKGKTKGVFQFESGGMQDMLMKLKPDRLEDLIAANALYRPGPMALIPDYIDRKHGGKWTVPHPIMREVLEETFGIMVYQEQVMRICNRLGDIPLREAYGLIKAIGKKMLDKIASAKKLFVEGCVKKGLTETVAEEIFELIERFAGYGFNKSHATRYSFVAYQTAWLKTYYPVEFMAALLTYEMGDTDKVVEYIGECRGMGIEVLPPEINESFVDFTVVYNKEHGATSGSVIRFGLAAVKGVGAKAVEQIIAARQKAGRFKSLFHFCENVDLRAVNKQVMEALIKAGAFDNLGGSRAQMMAALEKAMQAGASMQVDTQRGQMNFFGAGGFGDDKSDAQTLPDVPPWPETQMLVYEKEVLGFYVTSNPLSKYAEQIDAYSTCNTARLSGMKEGAEVVIGGMISKVRTMLTRNGKTAGQKMAVLELEDLQGKCEVVLFPKAYENFGAMVEVDKVVFVRGKVDTRRENPNILADELIGLEDVVDKLAAQVWINLFSHEISEEKINRIKSLCSTHRGKSPLHVRVQTGSFQIVAIADRSLSVRPDADFYHKLESVVGAGKVRLRSN
ncbi:MAG TPA: DNA polymerase III subunit alpha [Anaerohalosphaeraceae bacterium]|nr:DNA polymerase III subunit alpha [Anaerohalosphaeraceae bacterium]